MDLPINQIICGDALEVMRDLPKNSIDLVVADPPFFTPATHYQSRVVWQRTFADLSPLRIFWNNITKEVCRIIRQTGHFLVFCNCDSFSVFYEPMYNSFQVTKSLVWNKLNIGLGRIWRHQHELIIAARNSDCKFNDDGKLRRDVISVKATRSEKRTHPVEKPIKLLRQLIEPTTLEGDLVLDPFCGSGTTLIAAQLSRRKWIGVDLNPKYVEVAKRNIEKYTLFKPLTTFGIDSQATYKDVRNAFPNSMENVAVNGG